MWALRATWEFTIAVPIAVIVIALVLIRTLWLPGVGCWLLYLFSLVTSVAVVALGLFMLGAGWLLKHWLEARDAEDLLRYLSSGIAIVLVFVGSRFLRTWQKQPFPTFMRWFIRRSFRARVGGGVLPTGLPTTHPHWLAHYAVYNEAYPDGRFGSGPVEGWGVRACRRRVLAIKRR